MKKGTSILNNYTDELKELYLNSDLPLEKIGEIYNVSRETVTNFAKRQGWYGLRQDAPRATYQLNQEYFDVIDSEDKAYWLGFIAADGNILRFKPVFQIDAQFALGQIPHVTHRSYYFIFTS